MPQLLFLAEHNRPFLALGANFQSEILDISWSYVKCSIMMVEALNGGVHTPGLVCIQSYPWIS